MSIPLFDVQAGFGGATCGKTDLITADDLCAEMRRTSIDRALVRIDPDDLAKDVPRSNDILLGACREHPELIPCPIVVAQGGGGILSAKDQVDAAIEMGAGAVVVRPAADSWSLAAWGCDDLFLELQERRLPVLCLNRYVSFDAVADLAGRYRSLPLIVAEIAYRTQRIVVPLMKRFSNTCLSIGSNFTVHQGIEQLASEVGAERLLFGTGYPGTDGMPAITLLMYAEISDEQKTMIGAANLERLLSGIQK